MDVDVEAACADQLQRPAKRGIHVATLDPGDQGLRDAGPSGQGLLGHPRSAARFPYKLSGVHEKASYAYLR
jgi:hypothetical protein